MADALPWSPGAATGIGSMPGTAPHEATSIVLGELPDFPHLPELPGRGAGADMLGRTAAMLVDLATEVIPTGYRVVTRPGKDHRRAVDMLRRDVDAVHEAVDHAGAAPPVLKTQLAGPWSLVAGLELPRGHRVLTDHGAVREFTESLIEGMHRHVEELRRRTGAEVVVQLDEPMLPTVLAGAVPTPSGYGTAPAIPEPEARELLRGVVAAARHSTDAPVIVHCCAHRPPVRMLCDAGADAVAVDATLLDGTPAAFTDQLGEALDAGTVLLLGLLPGAPPAKDIGLYEAASPALRLVDRLGFARNILARQAVPTPCCGLAGATDSWMRRALSLSRDIGRAFVEPPEDW